MVVVAPGFSFGPLPVSSMLETTAANIITEARYRADAQTLTPATDFTTDDELLTILTKATREFIDLIISCDDAAIEILAVNVALVPPDYTLPDDFYRLVDAAVPDPTSSNKWLSLKQYNWRERNDFQDEVRPRYRLVNFEFKLAPPTAQPSEVLIHYVPYGPSLISLSPVMSINGWDDFLVATVALHIITKEDRDPSVMLALRQSAAERIREACRNLVTGNTLTVGRVEYQYEEIYDLI